MEKLAYLHIILSFFYAVRCRNRKHLISWAWFAKYFLFLRPWVLLFFLWMGTRQRMPQTNSTWKCCIFIPAFYMASRFPTHTSHLSMCAFHTRETHFKCASSSNNKKCRPHDDNNVNNGIQLSTANNSTLQTEFWVEKFKRYSPPQKS